MEIFTSTETIVKGLKLHFWFLISIKYFNSLLNNSAQPNARFGLQETLNGSKRELNFVQFSLKCLILCG